MRKRKPRTFLDYLLIAKTIDKLGGDPSFIWLLERMTQGRIFGKNADAQKQIDNLCQNFFENLKTVIDKSLAEYMAKANYPLLEEDVLKSSYPTGLEDKPTAVFQKGSDKLDYHSAAYKSDFNDPFGAAPPKSKLRKTRAEATAPDTFKMTKVAASESGTISDMGDPFGKAQAEIPENPTPVLAPGTRVKHRGRTGTVRHVSTSALEDPKVRGVAVEFDDTSVGMFCCEELEQ
jgi:hypothetical protein